MSGFDLIDPIIAKIKRFEATEEVDFSTVRENFPAPYSSQLPELTRMQVDISNPRNKPIYFGIIDTLAGKRMHFGVCTSNDPEADEGWPKLFEWVEWKHPPGSNSIEDYLLPLTAAALSVKQWFTNNYGS